MVSKGVLTLEYHIGRKTKSALKYRLLRRTKEVLEAIRKYKGEGIILCDIGTADGMMLNILEQRLNCKRIIGLDYSIELLKVNTNPKLNLVQGDAVKLPFEDYSFDVVVATAVIEHVSDAEKMLKECYRVLKSDGLCIITTPVPFFERIATKIGHLEAEHHQKTFKLPELASLVKSKSFKILEAEKFMMSPIGFPGENTIEKVMRVIGLSFLLMNQIVVADKQEREFRVG